MKLIRVRDLPPPRPGRTLPNGVHIEARQPMLRCSACGGEYSANPGNYFMADPNTVMRCHGRPLQLVDRVVTYQPVRVG